MTLATIGRGGRPRLVPICFVVIDDQLWTPLDAKPKSIGDARALARVRDIARDPRVTLLVDRWSEDWTDLAWLRLEGSALLVEPPLPDGVAGALVERYPQYLSHDLATRPAIRIDIERTVAWHAQGATGG